MKKVTVTFVYDEVDDKEEQYYIDKAFDEIYNSDDVLDTDAFLIEDYENKNPISLTKYVGYFNNKKYDVVDIDKKDNKIGLVYVEGCTHLCWCTFDKIEERR